MPKYGKDGKERKREKKERLNNVNNNGQLHIANATSGGARKAAWANFLCCSFLGRPVVTKGECPLVT